MRIEPHIFITKDSSMNLIKKLLTAIAGLAVVGATTILSTSQAMAVSASISSNFNGTAIPSGSSIWFNSVLSTPKGTTSGPVSISFTGQQISFTSGGTNYNLDVPNTTVTFSPTATTATTAFDTNNQQWVTTVPSSGLSGNTFLSGLSFQVPSSGLPGGINPVTWSGNFSSNQTVTSSWKWAAAVYTSFSNDYNSLGVKPVDDKQASVYQNSDKAGTPENYKSFVTGGARGSGGSNYTGGYSGTDSLQLNAEPNAVPFEFSPGLGILALGACTGIAQLRSKVQKWKSYKPNFNIPTTK